MASAAAMPAGCAETPETDDPRPRGLEIQVAPLELVGVADAEYTLTVTNGAAQTLWSRTISASQFGAPGGSLTYIGTCDASSNPNTVALEIVNLYDAQGQALAAGSWLNPTAGGPLTRDVTCIENGDVPVDFDLTIARSANQGFFDVAVAFDDIFCSAKLDCGETTDAAEALRLLHNASGIRDTSVVLGFACTGGPDAADTWLYMNNLRIDCALGTGQSTLVDVSG